MAFTNKLLKEYSPEDVQVTWNSIPIDGFAEGTFVVFERAADAFTKYVGATGTVARTRNADRTGTVTLTLMQNSLSNQLLAAQAALDESGLTPAIGNFSVVDPSGSGIAVAFDAWIRKIPNQELAGEYGSREWVFDCAYVKIIGAS